MSPVPPRAGYGSVFGDETTLGLGLPLERPTVDPEQASREYYDDPAEAFTRAAAFLQPPGDSVPVPFATFVADGNPLARKPRPA